MQNVVPAVLKTVVFIFTTGGNHFGHIPIVTCVHVSDLCCCKLPLTLLRVRNAARNDRKSLATAGAP